MGVRVAGIECKKILIDLLRRTTGCAAQFCQVLPRMEVAGRDFEYCLRCIRVGFPVARRAGDGRQVSRRLKLWIIALRLPGDFESAPRGSHGLGAIAFSRRKNTCLLESCLPFRLAAMGHEVVEREARLGGLIDERLIEDAKLPI